MLTGQKRAAAAMTSIAAMKFGDGTDSVYESRHAAMALFGVAAPTRCSRRRAHGAQRSPSSTTCADEAPPAPLGHCAALLTARVLAGAELGRRVRVLSQSARHPRQPSRGALDLLGPVDTALETFGSALRSRAGGGSVAHPRRPRAARVIWSDFGLRSARRACRRGRPTTARGAVRLVARRRRGRPHALSPLHGDHPNMAASPPCRQPEMCTVCEVRGSAVRGRCSATTDPLYLNIARFRVFTNTSGLPGAVARVSAKTSGATAPVARRRPAATPKRWRRPPAGARAAP